MHLRAAAILAAVTLASAACQSNQGAPGSASSGPAPSSQLQTLDDKSPTALLTRHQLQARLMGFADRYLNRMSEALDTAAANHPTPACRVAAQATKYYPGLTMVTVACEPDPSVALLDMLVVVTLERMVWEGPWAKDVFGDQAEGVMHAQREVEQDIWNVATHFLTPPQLTEMRALIEEWRARNPNRRYVSSMRFDDIVALRQGRSEVAFDLDMLAPVTEAARTVEETRILGERTLFIAARMPILVHWQTELLLHEATARPEFLQLVGDANTFAASSKRLTEIAAQWPDDALIRRVDDLMVRRVEHAGAQARSAVSQLFWTGAGLIVLAFAASVGGIYVWRKMGRR